MLCSKHLTQNKSYFDKYAHDHAYHRDATFYFAILNIIKEIRQEKRNKVLDLGCGDGSFIKDMIKSGIDGDFIGIDVSQTMINMARENLNNPLVKLLLGDGFNLPLRSDLKFDLIHIDSVLHHLIAATRGRSLVLIDRLIQVLIERLEEDGILVIEEFYYNSYTLQHMTSSIIFYGLKLINFLHIDVSKVFNEVKPELEVNFLSDREIEELLQRNELAFRSIRRIKNKVPRLYRLFLLKDTGYISFIATTNPTVALSFE